VRRGVRRAVRRAPALTAAGAILAGLCPAGISLAGDAPATLTIGLFVPRTGAQAAAGRDAARGAAIAVDRANHEQTMAGRSIRLIETSSDGAWETGARGLARLVHDDGAIAVIGGLDGRTAHVAEQVIVRSRGAALFVTPWAGETTLTALPIPWFFSLVPDNRRQADRLVEEIFSTRRLARVAISVDDGFDGRAAAAAFMAAAPAGAVLRLESQDVDRSTDLAAKLRAGRAEAVVLFGDPAAAGVRARSIVESGLRVPLFAPLALACEEFRRSAGEAAGRLIVLAPDVGGSVPGGIGSAAAARFAAEYRARHGADPTPVAMYAHDAVAAVLAAARVALEPIATARATGGPGTTRPPTARPTLAEALAGIAIDGATGPVRFDGHRSRLQVPDPRPLWAAASGGSCAGSR